MEDSDTRITGLMADHQPPHNAMSQGPSDGGHVSLSNTPMQPETLPVSQLETTSMPDESLIPCHTPSDSLPDSPQNVPAPDASQPAIVSDVHSGTQQAFTSPSPDSAEYSVAHMDSGSDDNTYSTNSIHECGGPFVDLSTPSIPSPCPLLVPLPESDVEEDPSESLQDEGVANTASSSSENSDAYTTSTGGRTSPSGDPEPQNVVQPSAADDYLALWILGDSVLERHDRRAYERWKAGLGVTFVLANILSVIILCIALEFYRRTKAAHPTLVSKIRARHRARTGRDSPFSPIVSLFFEADAPFLNSNTAFLTGLCTTLICTLLVRHRPALDRSLRGPPASLPPRRPASAWSRAWNGTSAWSDTPFPGCSRSASQGSSTSRCSSSSQEPSCAPFLFSTRPAAGHSACCAWPSPSVRCGRSSRRLMPGSGRNLFLLPHGA
ncbi:hypothetical protein EDB89DRAFT_1992287 [Lactarius sanguifluus]|nr:hypothetical protein EDB89DRAFT_1992287 [Lactarius sanguifluus]